MISHSSEKTLSSILNEAKQGEPLIGAEEAQQLISAQRIVHKADSMRPRWRKPLTTAFISVLSAAIGALAVVFVSEHRGPILPFSPDAGHYTGAANVAAQHGDDSPSKASWHPFYRYFAYDTLFERKLRNLPQGAGSSDIAMRYVELTPDELAQIGIRIDEANVELYKVFEPVPELAARFVIDGEGIHYPNMKKIATHPYVNVPRFEPRLISDDRGMWRRIAVADNDLDQKLVEELNRASNSASDTSRWYTNLVMELSNRAEEKLRRRINMLIPILVRTGGQYTEADRRARRFRPDVIFWYEPTDEFLAHLPERVASQLRVELAASELMTTADHLRPEQAGQRRPDLRGGEHDALVREEQAAEAVNEYVDRVVGGEKYLDVWRTSAGAIQGSYLYPNPAPEGRTTLHYKLAEARSVVVVLYDIWGRRVRDLTPLELRQAGEGEFVLSCGDLPEGMYVVVLQTERGEQAVQRLMIN